MVKILRIIEKNACSIAIPALPAIYLSAMHAQDSEYLPSAAESPKPSYSNPAQYLLSERGRPGHVHTRSSFNYLRNFTITYGISTSSSVWSSAVISKMTFFWCDGMGFLLMVSTSWSSLASIVSTKFFVYTTWARAARE